MKTDSTGDWKNSQLIYIAYLLIGRVEVKAVLGFAQGNSELY